MPNLTVAKSPLIISDKIDEMVIVIQVNSGAYYSLTPAGSALWAKVEAGDSTFSDQETAQLLAFAGEEILQVTGGEGVTAEPFSVVGTKFTDMEGLLTGDPIHEVDEQGWPALKDKEN
jgi:hypothetical protein